MTGVQTCALPIFKGRLIRTTHGGMGIIGEPASFYGAASGIEARGFDGVIFGHTHHPGSAALPYGGRYVNPGSWMLNSKFVQIENGKIELKDFLKISGEKKDARFAG